MLKIGELLDNKYRILSEVGHGGMSTVYLARNERANKNWAVKEVRKNGTSQYDVVKQSLLAEVEIMKRLNNPHLPSIVDVLDQDDTFLIVMDFVEGNSLDKELSKGPVPEADVVNWGIQLCDVLMYLHNLNPPIIYRDMKPANVILRPDGVVVLLDFGTAKEYKSRKAGDDTTCLGTRGYAAPEQYGGMGRTDGRTDIYCLGATLYHLVTGMNPGLPPYEMKPIRQVNRNLSDGLEKIILKCTRPDPNERYQTCEELKFDLEHVDEIGRRAQMKRNRNIGLFVSSIALCLLGVIGMIGFRVAASNATTSSYDYYVEQAEGLTDADSKMDCYIQAVEVAPARAEAYEGLLDYIMEDSEITADEANLMTTLLGQVVNGTSARERFQEKNPEGFEGFSYDLGLDYYLFYENEDTGKSLAKQYLQYAAEGTTLTSAQQRTAQNMYTIASSISKLNQKVNSDYTYEDYWEDLNNLIQDDMLDQIGYYITLNLYRYTVSTMFSDMSSFKNMGDVSQDDMEQLLARIEAGIDAVEASETLDTEDTDLVAQLRTKISQVEDRFDEIYGK
ncbi:MAG: serine/threonine protein kinase [Lachnospiraceae bacterium]|nr:serine/threonine protein kinase [Lachnospiraceae bacterium]